MASKSSGSSGSSKSSSPAPATAAKTTVASASKAISNANAVISKASSVPAKNKAAFQKGVATLMNTESQLATALGGLAGALGGGNGSGYQNGAQTDAFAIKNGSTTTSSSGTHYINGQVVDQQTWNNFLNPNGSNSGGGSAAGATADTATSDAFATLTSLLNSYGLETLGPSLTRMMQAGLTSQEAFTKIKYDKTIDPVTGQPYNAVYTTRFAGNTARVNAGLNALTEAQYLNLEDSYANTLKSYGLGNMLSTDRAANEKMFAKYISQDLSAVEFTDRIKLAEDTIANSDPAVLQNFKNFYGTLTNKDLVAYVLAPDETLPKLQTKAAAAQIGAAANAQGLSATSASAEALALQGVTYSQAQAGYAKIGQELPVAQRLNSIYNGQIQGNYDQASAEAEQFSTTGAASAARKKQQLKDLETQQFNARSGVIGANVSAGYSGSLGQSIQGSF